MDCRYVFIIYFKSKYNQGSINMNINITLSFFQFITNNTNKYVSCNILILKKYIYIYIYFQPIKVKKLKLVLKCLSLTNTSLANKISKFQLILLDTTFLFGARDISFLIQRPFNQCIL